MEITMKKLLTAEELMQSKNGNDYTYWEEIHGLMIDFAKGHVEAAVNAIVEKAQAKEDPADYGTGKIWVDEKSIRSAYPLENIK